MNFRYFPCVVKYNSFDLFLPTIQNGKNHSWLAGWIWSGLGRSLPTSALDERGKGTLNLNLVFRRLKLLAKDGEDGKGRRVVWEAGRPLAGRLGAGGEPGVPEVPARVCRLSSMVIRDLTLRSAASFGSFHLIRLLYDEYMFYLVEHRVAEATGETPIAVMGEVSAAGGEGRPQGPREHTRGGGRRVGKSPPAQAGQALAPRSPTHVTRAGFPPHCGKIHRT